MKGDFYKYRLLHIAISVILLLAGCVKFETGRTEREETIDKQQQAKNIRGNWAAQIQGGSKENVAQLLVDQLDHLTTQYLDFGGRVGDQWREANKGRGEEVKASEMITVVDRWIEKEKNILEANEDNIEYAASYLRTEFNLSSDQKLSLETMIKEYYNVYNIVFLPNDNVLEYSQRLDDSRLDVNQATDDFRRKYGL